MLGSELVHEYESDSRVTMCPLESTSWRLTLLRSSVVSVMIGSARIRSVDGALPGAVGEPHATSNATAAETTIAVRTARPVTVTG